MSKVKPQTCNFICSSHLCVNYKTSSEVIDSDDETKLMEMPMSPRIVIITKCKERERTFTQLVNDENLILVWKVFDLLEDKFMIFG